MEHHIFTDAHMSEPMFVSAAQGQVGVFSARAPDSDEERNEDSSAVFAIDERRAVLALADGVGGYRAGDIASSTAMQELKRAIENGLREEKGLRACVIDGFENANRAVVETGTGAATTLVVLEIDGDVIRPYHAGDSTIISVGLRGKLKLQTVAHSPVGYAVESGVINEREAMRHDERHLVSNVVGNPDMHIEVGPSVSMARRDTVILASDGLTDNLRTPQIADIIRKGPLQKSAHRLAGEAQRRMLREGSVSKPDDLTFLIYRRTR